MPTKTASKQTKPKAMTAPATSKPKKGTSATKVSTVANKAIEKKAPAVEKATAASVKKDAEEAAKKKDAEKAAKKKEDDKVAKKKEARKAAKLLKKQKLAEKATKKKEAKKAKAKALAQLEEKILAQNVKIDKMLKTTKTSGKKVTKDKKEKTVTASDDTDSDNVIPTSSDESSDEEGSDASSETDEEEDDGEDDSLATDDEDDDDDDDDDEDDDDDDDDISSDCEEPPKTKLRVEDLKKIIKNQREIIDDMKREKQQRAKGGDKKKKKKKSESKKEEATKATGKKKGMALRDLATSASKAGTGGSEFAPRWCPTYPEWNPKQVIEEINAKVEEAMKRWHAGDTKISPIPHNQTVHIATLRASTVEIIHCLGTHAETPDSKLTTDGLLLKIKVLQLLTTHVVALTSVMAFPRCHSDQMLNHINAHYCQAVNDTLTSDSTPKELAGTIQSPKFVVGLSSEGFRKGEKDKNDFLRARANAPYPQRVATAAAATSVGILPTPKNEDKPPGTG